MTPGSPPPDDDTAATGASEADAARPVTFKPGHDRGPATEEAPHDDDPPDAAEAAGFKRKDGDVEPKRAAEPGTVAPEDLTTESDDGVS